MTAVNQEEMLRVLLAYSARWRSECAASSVDEALLQLKGFQASDETEDDAEPAVSYPRAVIEEVERERTLAGTGTWRGRGTLLLSIEAVPPDDQLETIDAQREWVLDFVNTVEAELRTTSAGRTTPTGYSISHFQIKNISWAVEPFLLPEAEQPEEETSDDTVPANLWACQLRVEY